MHLWGRFSVGLLLNASAIFYALAGNWILAVSSGLLTVTYCCYSFYWYGWDEGYKHANELSERLIKKITD